MRMVFLLDPYILRWSHYSLFQGCSIGNYKQEIQNLKRLLEIERKEKEDLEVNILLLPLFTFADCLKMNNLNSPARNNIDFQANNIIVTSE